MKALILLCPVHANKAVSYVGSQANCQSCEEMVSPSELLFCTLCGAHYHGFCLDPAVRVTTSTRVGWQCPDCKACQACRRPGDEARLLTCDICDKGFHVYCVKPVVANVPKHGWKCQNCRVCGDCGSRTPGSGPSSRWHMNFSVCDSCYQQRNKGVACPLCGKAYRQFSHREDMAQCTMCRKYIHMECDSQLANHQDADYVCPVCNNTRQQATGGKLAAKRRAKAVELRRKRGPKPKLKSYFLGCNVPQGATAAIPETKDLKQDDEPAMDNKMVLFSASDDFVLSQDLCAMCGSFGRAEEGRLIACAQCGQCYHPYCVNVKVTRMILKKGWRCLDCTVCEGCGQPHDESRLLLCDECDISYHTYCLSPPLENVPQGNWKCRWCVVCLQCGATDPGFGSHWQNNYTQCGPCASKTSCPLCLLKYQENDLVIQCVQCERWMHGFCDQIACEEDAEKCAEYGYNCPYCRPKDELPPHLLKEYIEPPPPAPVKAKPQPAQFYMDGVFLSESGMHQIKALTIEQPKRQRARRPRVPSGGPPPTPTLAGAFGAFRGRLSTEDSEDGSKDLPDMDVEPKMEVDEETKLTSEEVAKLDAESELKKKRQRKLQKLATEPSSEAALAALAGDGASQAPEAPADVAAAGGPEKPKRRRRVKKKNPLEDSFPSYLQEAFFGHDLLLTSRTEPTPEMPSEDEEDSAPGRPEANMIVLEALQDPSEDAPSDSGAPSPAARTGSKGVSPALQDEGTSTPVKTGSDDEDLGLKDILPHDLPQDDELMDMLMNEGDDLSKQGSGSRGVKDNDPLSGNNIDTVLLSPHFNLVDSMVSAGSGGPNDSVGSIGTSGAGMSPLQQPGSSGARPPPLMQNPLTPASSHSVGSPFSMPSPSPFPVDYGSPQLSEPPPSPWMDPEAELPSSGGQKNILKWESDEALGSGATISPVLYANLNCQNLRMEYPIGKGHQMMLGETSPAGSLSPSAPSPTPSQLMGAAAQSPLSPAQAQRSPGPVRVPPAPVSPLIQVSRVRPPIDPSRLPPSGSDPYALPMAPSSSAGPLGVAERFLPPRPPPVGGLVGAPPRMLRPPEDGTRTTPPHTPSPTGRGPLDPYAQMPGTPRPAPSDTSAYHQPYLRAQPGGPPLKVARPPPQADPYAAPPGTPMPEPGQARYSPQPVYGAPRVPQQAQVCDGRAPQSFS
ncbi:hypothetical protein IscW_ISCW023204 [Ixodes scapularis]|uniref:PHD-type domain-containing protein n=1 Tax=Ixodes scapularis TaxID=6945 RepID=B7QM38_IXOSC|nr:hypothetical protein IscW_ISCW023204 [Ixodes scapularis]|eukprot:XP_002416243.1 hypothetical protein IscW_ISCW023204 [Ixodes scapularis]